MEPIRIYGRHGNVNAARGINEDTQSHTDLQPSTTFGEFFMFVNQLQDKSNPALLEIAFRTLRNSDYGEFIAEHFENNSGETMRHTMSRWNNDYFSGKTDFFDAIRNAIRNHHSSFHNYQDTIDVSAAIRENMPSFRFAPFNKSEMIAIGGIQEVEVSNLWLNQDLGYSNFTGDPITSSSKFHTANIRFEVLIKDWFGVDEGDFTNNRVAALLDRRGLVALWILQHQRGFRPFINVFRYIFTMKVNFGLACHF